MFCSCALRNVSQNRVWADCRHAFSATHVKSHAILKGEFEVLGDLEKPELAQGLFSKPAKYPAAMRHSTETIAMIDDTIRQPRGMAFKVFNVEGPKLRPDGKDPRTQDFEFNSASTIELANAKICRDIMAMRLKLGSCPADLDAELKKRDDYDVQDARNHIPTISLLAQRQYSQSAFRYGDYVAKFALVPTPGTSQLKGADTELSSNDGPHAYKDMLRQHYAENDDTSWDFQVQLLDRQWFEKNPEAIEDGRIDWPQDLMPFVTVAKLRCPRQDSMLPARRVFWEDRIRVDPWHGLVAHRPLGSINRVRKGVYKMSSAHRRRLNATQEVTIESIDQIPDGVTSDDEKLRAP